MKRILLTNDDGYMARGIQCLAEALSEVGEIYVVAPSSQRSACGHMISMHGPMIVREVGVPFSVKAWSVDGTPADCVKLGIRELVKDVDLVVSGINHGSNLAEDCFYSGTVAGAAEAVFCDTMAIAVSVANEHPDYFEGAMDIAKKAALLALEKGIEPETVLNINVPNLPREEIKGARITEMGHIKYDENFYHSPSIMGGEAYRYNGTPVKLPQMTGSDIQAIRDGFVSVTPLKFDVTCREVMEKYRSWFV